MLNISFVKIEGCGRFWKVIKNVRDGMGGYVNPCEAM